MTLRSVLFLSLFVACSGDPADLDPIDPGTNPNNLNPQPPVPDPNRDQPDPEPEPNFELVNGWYEADVDIDVRVETPINLPLIGETEVNTTCEGIAVFEVRGERIQNGYWECILPGEDGFNLNNIVTSILGWQGSVLRFLWGTYEGSQCTGELEDGKCSLKGEIDGLFNQDTGTILAQVSMKTSQQGPLQDLASNNGFDFLVTFLNGLGVAPFTIDRENQAEGNGSEGLVSFDYVDDQTRTTDFVFELDGEWVATSAPPYNFNQLTEGL